MFSGKTFNRLVYLTGAYTILSPALRVHFSYSEHDGEPQKKYDRFEVESNMRKYVDLKGEKPWAIITGASEGIGKQYAIDIA